MTQLQPTAYPASTRLPRWLALVLAIGIIGLGGALYGTYSQRWGPAPDLQAAGAHLAEMPHQIGNWQMISEQPIGETALTMLECTGYVNRSYVNQGSGQTINVAMLVGPPGPIAVHTPEICYSSRSYELQGDRVEVALPGSTMLPDRFWAIDFTTRGVLAEGLRVYYGWSIGGPWMASVNPRFEYASAPYLYKLQLAASMSPGATSDAGREFLDALSAADWNISVK